MNRGSLVRIPTKISNIVSFNEAPIHESGKSLVECLRLNRPLSLQ